MKIDLAFTAYNRVNYAQVVVDSWNSVRSLDTLNVYVSLEPSPLQTYMAREFNRLETTVVVDVNPERLGVLVNPWETINRRFMDGADFVVLAEDDVVVSTDAIELLSWAAETYENDESVLLINLFSQIGGGNPDEVVRDGKFSPLVWGIWRNRWVDYIRDTWDKDYTSGKEDGSEAGWDWNINRILAETGKDVIKPVQSRSDHIGKLGGTHMTPDLFDSSRGVDFVSARGRVLYSEI